ncbi:MAG: carboxypeptidase regulatory-like domain-containing protein, partial [Actinobacteria bacterium]|nr:carboxypeptidase regulatory-like domain-containing protein [Actinomycetota bacterium]NIS28781.1 carboxypeptidase regulatory-like domain-containing protein [Actinomycetota bacterium]NIW26034.1 MFS transporter [Actinomycetota bacterium]
MRSIGTSSSSAAMAAVVTLGVVRVGEEVHPSFGALATVFWVAAVMSLGAALLTVPTFRMRELPEEPPGAGGHMRDTVVHGRVVSTTGRPVRNAVVTLLTPSGEQVDWSQVDSAGDFSIAVPGAGRYLVVTAAEGWTPESRLADLAAETEIEPIVLRERLTLAGTVNDPYGPVDGAVVALTQQSGEVVGTARSGTDGRYEMPLPPNGRYVLTAVTPAGATAASAVTVWGATRTMDFDLPAGDGT